MVAILSLSFNKLPKPLIIILVMALIFLIGVLDYLTGFEMSLNFFYLAPISIAVWYINKPAAIGASIASDLAWLLVDFLNRSVYESPPALVLWNVGMRLAFFLVFALLLSSLRHAMDDERLRAGTDFLTGASNLRAFFERAGIELDRARRYHHPLSIAYMDLDDFKALNDRFGHIMGDEALKALGSVLLQQIRLGDLAGRLGGDEFAVLLPETGDEEALAVATRLHMALTNEITRNNWPVSISMGVLTCRETSINVTQLMTEVDNLMYEVKRSGKNNLKHKSLNENS